MKNTLRGLMLRLAFGALFLIFAFELMWGFIGGK